jgi:hypothetical protein
MSVAVLGAATPAAHAATGVPVSRLNRLPLRPGGGAGARSRPAEVTAGGARVWGQAAEITGASDSLFGFSEAVSGDTMVVGAPYDNSGTGAAYVYAGSGSTWTQEAELTPSDGVANDTFGISVALTSTTIVVGAECHSATAPSCEGAVYVFQGSGSTWNQVDETQDPGQTADDYFGWPLTMTGDSIMVSATGENSNAGTVFVYDLDGSAVAPGPVLDDPGNAPNEEFGFGIAVTAKTLVVGAPGVPGASTGAFTGAAYVYDETGGIWPSVPSATLAASNGEGCVSTCSNSFGYVGGDNFGDAVAVKGATLVVGAPYASVPTPAADGVGTGSAYVFHLSGRVWTQSDELYDPAEATAAAENWFGYQVAVLGRSSFMVSAPYDPRGAFNNATGAAYVFSRKGGTWTTYPTELTALDGAAGDYFGYDGLTTIGRKYVLVGSANSPDGGLYIFRHR